MRSWVHTSLLLATGAVGFGMYEFEGQKKDVCVVGGGAAGSYAAASLAMRGYDVVLFEPQDRLGGNCQRYEYESPAGETATVNWGVTHWGNTSIVRDFLTLFEVNYHKATRGIKQGVLYDPTFDLLLSPQACDAECQIDFGVAIATYSELHASFGVDYAAAEVPNFADLPSATADALLSPFGTFVSEMNLTATLRPIMPLLAQWLQGLEVGLLEMPLYKVFTVAPLGGLLYMTGQDDESYIMLEPGCQHLYDKVQAYLEAEPGRLHLEATVRAARRTNDDEVHLTVVENRNTANSVVEYRCDDALFAFRPDSLAKESPFLEDLTDEERLYFQSLEYPGFVTSLWTMDLTPGLEEIFTRGFPTFDADEPSSFSPMSIDLATAVVVGEPPPAISNLQRNGTSGVKLADHAPYTVSYQTPEPAHDLSALRNDIASALELLGWTNLTNIDLAAHKYGLWPNASTIRDFFGFAHRINYEDDDHLYFIGSAISYESVARVWAHANQLIEHHFPPVTSGN